MSVAARVAREMGVKLGNEVRSVGTEGRGEPLGSWTQPPLPAGPLNPHQSRCSPLSLCPPFWGHQPNCRSLMAHMTGRLQHPL